MGDLAMPTFGPPCDCGALTAMPVGAISVICDGDVEHSETACIPCPVIA